MSEQIRTEPPYHMLSKELMRWISRAFEAEARVAELEKVLVRVKKADAAWAWGEKVIAFLKKAADPPFCVELGEASRLYTEAIALGIIPEPDCRLGKTWEEYAREKSWPGDVFPCPPDQGVIPEICPKCGGRKV